MSKRASADVLAAHATEPKTALVVWIHFDGYGITQTVYRTTKEFAVMLDNADGQRPPPPKRLCGIGANLKLSEKHQLLKDGITHKALDKIDGDDEHYLYEDDDDDDDDKSVHERDYCYDEHTVIVATM